MSIVVLCLSKKKIFLNLCFLIILSRYRERLDEIITNKQSKRYFLMSRIHPPIYSSLIRLSQTNDNKEQIIEKQTTGELGIFGGIISQNGRIIYERVGGSLFRSKSATSIEGGIASGQGCIDSILFI